MVAIYPHSCSHSPRRQAASLEVGMTTNKLINPQGVVKGLRIPASTEEW